MGLKYWNEFVIGGGLSFELNDLLWILKIGNDETLWENDAGILDKLE